jgi:hypothetical protein
MSDEADEPKGSSWIAFWIVMGTLFGFAVLVRVFRSPTTDVPNNSAYAVGPYAPSDGGEATRIKFGAGKAVGIAIDEVKKREGWSSDPDWVTVKAEEALTWEVTVRRMPRSQVGERLVVVSALTGKVLHYRDTSDDFPHTQATGDL